MKGLITDAMLKAVMPHAPSRVRAAELPLLNHAAFHYQINTKRRVSAWLATLAAESGELRYQQELASGAAYEGRKDLGNTQPGDGRRFKGHGRIQGTGRDVHQAYTDYLRKSKHLPFVDFVKEPARLGTAPYSTDFAGWFVNGYKHLNDEADAGNFLGYSTGVNGRNRNGLPNHWDVRQGYYRRGLAAIPDGWTLAVDVPELTDEHIEAAVTEAYNDTGYPDFDTTTGLPIGSPVLSENGRTDLTLGPGGENGLDRRESPGNATTEQGKPAELVKEAPSTFTKWFTGIKIAAGGLITSLTAYCGGSQIPEVIGNKAVDAATPEVLPKLAFILLYTAIGVGAGVLLIWIASKFYDKSANRAANANIQKAAAAASEEQITYDFKQE